MRVALLSLYLQLALVIGVLVVVGSLLIVGRGRFRHIQGEYRRRFRRIAPHLALVGLVLFLSTLLRRVGTEVSWLVGRNITGTIHAIEGDLVAWMQTFATVELTWFFTLIYIFGYAFLLVFPLVAYFVLPDLRMFRVTTLAYTFNYAIGLVCYTLFIAFGPRNFMPDEVESLMYVAWPQIELLTTHINVNTNVFPSLHTSLAVTVVLLAWATRRTYPRWLAVATPLAVGVLIATMYLGIHWATDVVGGTVLAVVAVWLAQRFAADTGEESPITRLGLAAIASVESTIRRLHGSQ